MVIKSKDNERNPFISCICIFIIFSVTTGTYATKVTPIQLSLFNPVQIFDNHYVIKGIRINLLYGNNNLIYGIDAGTINYAKNGVVGFQAGMVANVGGGIIGIQAGGALNISLMGGYGIQMAGLINHTGNFNGFQLAGILNSVEDFSLDRALAGASSSSRFAGVQLAGGMNYMGGNQSDLIGVQIAGGCNYLGGTNSHLHGVQISLLYNRVGDTVHGTQIGLINTADRVKGVQIGLINYTRSMSGIQIGLVNIIEEGALPFFPLFNASMSF